MASDFYLAIKTKKGGDIKGESSAMPFKDQIQVTKFTIAVNSPTGFDDQATGNVQLEHAEFEFETSLASVPLFTTICTNDVIKECTLSCRKAGVTGKLGTFLQWRFHDARLVSFKMGGDNDKVGDTITIAYSAVEVWYGKQNQDGSIGNGLVSCYDSGENAMSTCTLPDPKPNAKS